MKKVNIQLNTVDDVKMFVSTVTKYNCNFDIISDRYIVDAKSIMGIFSLDLSKPFILRTCPHRLKIYAKAYKDGK